MSTRLIKLLGPPAIEQQEVVPLKHSKVAALLAVLAVDGPASRERLSGLLWPDLPQKKASANLRGALHKLRSLAEGSLEANGEQLSLSPLWQVDLLRLRSARSRGERARAAQAKGLLCEGIQLPGCDELEQWLSQHRQLLQTEVVDNLLELSRLSSQAGDHEAALEAARSAVAHDQLSEPAHTRLIEVLMSAGDRAEASRQLQRLARIFQEELGIEPSPETFALLQTRPRPRKGHNLPARLTGFFGRQAEVEQVRQALDAHRLVTVTGIGGVGKTQLCLEVARHQLSQKCPADGIWLVRLASLSPGSPIDEALAAVLGLPVDSLLEQLSDKQSLILLDNCEHLMPRVREQALELLQNCPEVKLLVTSREPLQILGEQIIALAPLPLPDSSLSVAELAKLPALELLMERGRSLAPDLVLSEENAGALCQICCRLDGIPLALELAGARLGMLSPQQLLDRLEDRFQLLKSPGAKEPRQSTLSAMLDWSYQLLEPEARELLASLSIFEDSFELVAVEQVCLPEVADWQVLERLTSLADRSLVVSFSARDGSRRFRLLQTVKQFASQLLSESDLQRLVLAHLRYYHSLAQRASVGLSSAEQQGWLPRLDRELPNLRAAAARSLSGSQLVELGVDTCLALERYWQIRDLRSRVRDYLDRALQHPLDPALQARARRLAGELACDQGDLEQAAAQLERAASLVQAQAAPLEGARIWKARGTLHYCGGKLREARQSYGQALESFAAQSCDEGVAACHNNLGLVAFELDELEEAEGWMQLSLEAAQAAGDERSLALSLTNLGHLRLKQQRWPSAEKLLRQALGIYHELREYWTPTRETLLGLGQVFLHHHDIEAAGLVVGALKALAYQTRTAGLPSTRLSVEEFCAQFESQGGNPIQDAGDLEQMVARLLGLTPGRSGRPLNASEISAKAPDLR